MSSSSTSRREFLGALSALAAGAALGTERVLARAPSSELLHVIVSAKNPTSSLDLAQLRRVFLGQPTNDEGGHRFIPLNAPPHSRDRVLFDQRVLGMSPDTVAQFWIDQRIRGVQAPRTSISPELLVRVVAKLPGAITYVRGARLAPEVKALRIDGKLPGEPGYPL